MPRMLILSYEFPPMIGGAGSFARDLASFFSRTKYEVTVAANSDAINVHSKDNYSLLSIRAVRYVRLFLLWLGIRRHVDSSDIIIINDKRYHIAAALFFNRRVREKAVLYLHGDEDLDFLLRPRLALRFFGMQRKYLTLLKEVRLIVACSAFQKEKFIRNTKLHALEDNIAVVRNGVDPNLFYYDPFDVRGELAIHPSKTLLLSVSRIVRGKGFDTKYALFRRLLEKSPSFHWIVIGQGEYLESLRRRVHEDEMEGSVSLLGGIPRDRLRRYYSSCDVFWLLSELEESFSLVYAESAMCGTPVIGYDRAGVREAIVGGATGFLVHSGEEALELLATQQFTNLSRSKVARQAQVFSCEFSLQCLLGTIEARFAKHSP